LTSAGFSEPLSPDEAKSVTPSACASAITLVSALMFGQPLSLPPQLIDSTEGRLVASWIAVENASTHPWSVLGAKYTTSLAPGATDPATAISRITSVSALAPGELTAPSMPTDDTAGTGRLAMFVNHAWTSLSR